GELDVDARRGEDWWSRLALATSLLGRSEFTSLREATSISGPHVTPSGNRNLPYLGIDAARHDYLDATFGVRIAVWRSVVLSLGVFKGLNSESARRHRWSPGRGAREGGLSHKPTANAHGGGPRTRSTRALQDGGSALTATPKRGLVVHHIRTRKAVRRPGRRSARAGLVTLGREADDQEETRPAADGGRDIHRRCPVFSARPRRAPARGGLRRTCLGRLRPPNGCPQEAMTAVIPPSCLLHPTREDRIGQPRVGGQRSSIPGSLPAQVRVKGSAQCFTGSFAFPKAMNWTSSPRRARPVEKVRVPARVRDQLSKTGLRAQHRSLGQLAAQEHVERLTAEYGPKNAM